MIFLDTNICSYFLKGLYPSLGEKLKALSPKDVKIASIVKAELLFGAYRSPHRDRLEKWIGAFLQPFEVVSFDTDSANKYAEMRRLLEVDGQVIGPNDLILAATVASRHGLLITHNTREFSRLPGLKIEDWVA